MKLMWINYMFTVLALWPWTELQQNTIVQEGDILLPVRWRTITSLLQIHTLLWHWLSLLSVELTPERVADWTGGQERCAKRVVQRHSPVHHHRGRGCVKVPPGELMFLHWNRCHITVSSPPHSLTADRESDILKAFKMISNSTCIRFKPHTTEFNYLEFRLGKGWGIFSVSGWVSVCAKC